MNKHFTSRVLPSIASVASPPVELDAAKDYDDWLPDLGLAYRSAGDALIRARRFEDALEKYQASLGIFEQLASAEPHNRLAAALVRELKEKSGLIAEKALSKADNLGERTMSRFTPPRLPSPETNSRSWKACVRSNKSNPYSPLLCIAMLLIAGLMIEIGPTIHGLFAQNQ